MDPAGLIFKKKWAHSCACVRAPTCIVMMQLRWRKKINAINDIHASSFFFFTRHPGSIGTIAIMHLAYVCRSYIATIVVGSGLEFCVNSYIRIYRGRGD